MYAKKLPLTQYYILLFATLLVGKQKKFKLPTKEKEIINRFDFIRGLFSPKHKIFPKLPLIFYALLLEIPIKAKIKNYLEERKITSSHE